MKYYVVDAFAHAPFTGNPAGVCVLESELPAERMQQIAAQNNLAETAFVCKQGDDYALRWFTPVTEINLCGHATLATAFVLHQFAAPQASEFRFHTISGLLTVTPKGELYEMDFPAWPVQPVEITPLMRQAVGCDILEAHLARDLILLVSDVQTVTPDFAAIAAIPQAHGVAVTAPGKDCDFVSRFFAPNMGVPEDHVTGSIHSELIPFWAQRLGKDTLLAKQLSQRGGTLHCACRGDRVNIAGSARLYLTGEIHL
ncbi:MAG: PhzF family phenazine biosynthesis protein [Oscillospiraceae bacterium]|nr:PhzF family phenazine biosynthesis protein [Oscillospiraceae bacterium]